MIELPKKPVEAIIRNPKNLILYSKPKVGKTSALIGLEDSCLIDTEEGSDFVTGYKVKVSSIADIREFGECVIADNKPYKYLIIDTITKLEELCIPYAEELYARSPAGVNWFADGKKKYGNILYLPNGSGYMWLRTAYDNVIRYISSLAPYIIQSGHVKDIILDKAGTEVNSLELDLSGKLKRIAASDSDAIGYMYRKDNKNFISFKTSDTIACGARPVHLRNKDICISELMEDGSVITHWDEIYK